MIEAIKQFFAPTKAEAQTKRIVARLRRGTATNKELSKIALKYTSRISDARNQGHIIVCSRIQGGLTQYKLIGEAQA
ncbi:MAG: hypothetical protein KGH87_08060 [Thaumarchaeota archaeon]|nr:hypothetical protein [Nitrososphaerota archaeon]